MSGFNAAILLIVLVLPGAFFSWGFEKKVPRYGKQLKDWLVRLAGATAIWNAVVSWPLHWLYTSYWDDLAVGKTLPWPIYIAPIAYLLVPAAVGWGAGWLFARTEKKMPKVAEFLAPNRRPSAWDHLFGAEVPGFVRCCLKSGRWVGGAYYLAKPLRSYSSLAEAEKDIFIAHAVEFNQEDGTALRHQGDYVWTKGGIYITASQIESLEFIPHPDTSTKEENSNAEGRPGSGPTVI